MSNPMWLKDEDKDLSFEQMKDKFRSTGFVEGDIETLAQSAWKLMHGKLYTADKGK